MKRRHQLFTWVTLAVMLTQPIYTQENQRPQPINNNEACAYQDGCQATRWSAYIPVIALISAALLLSTADDHGHGSSSCSSSKSSYSHFYSYSSNSCSSDYSFSPCSSDSSDSCSYSYSSPSSNHSSISSCGCSKMMAGLSSLSRGYHSH